MAAGSAHPNRASKVRYQHIVVEGTPYEAGRLEGALLRQAGRSLISYEPPEPEETAREMRQLYEAYSPGLIEEAQGVADALGLSFEQALFCACIGLAVWSMVLDATAGTAEVRFGPPPHNGRHSFSLDGPVGVVEYKARFPDRETEGGLRTYQDGPILGEKKL